MICVDFMLFVGLNTVDWNMAPIDGVDFFLFALAV